MLFETRVPARPYLRFAVTCRANACRRARLRDNQDAGPLMQAHDSPSRFPKAAVAAAPLIWKAMSGTAWSARLVVLACFRLLEQINSPPFVDPELQRLGRKGALRAAAAARPPVPLLQLALRRFTQDEARVE